MGTAVLALRAGEEAGVPIACEFTEITRSKMRDETAEFLIKGFIVPCVMGPPKVPFKS